MMKSKTNTIRVARRVVIPQFAHAVVVLWVAMMVGLICTNTTTRFGTMKAKKKCVTNVQEQALKDGVLTAVLICRERAEHRLHWTAGSLRRHKHYLRPKLILSVERIQPRPPPSKANRWADILLNKGVL